MSWSTHPCYCHQQEPSPSHAPRSGRGGSGSNDLRVVTTAGDLDTGQGRRRSSHPGGSPVTTDHGSPRSPWRGASDRPPEVAHPASWRWSGGRPEGLFEPRRQHRSPSPHASSPPVLPVAPTAGSAATVRDAPDLGNDPKSVGAWWDLCVDRPSRRREVLGAVGRRRPGDGSGDADGVRPCDGGDVRADSWLARDRCVPMRPSVMERRAAEGNRDE